jgi:excinuclease UvrABC nuclease subunit
MGEIKDLNKICGVYLIYDESKKLIYIGSTGIFKVRVGT